MTDETLGSKRSDAEETEDLTLATAEPEDDEIEDVTGDLDVEEFDFAAFVEGSRPTRHAVRPAMRGDLLAVMETIVMRVEDAEKRGDTEAVDRLAGEYEEARAEFEASRRVFVVEARSTHRRRELEKQLEKRGLVQKPGKKASEQEKQDYARTLMAHQLADQVVSPKGVTAEGIEKLLDVNEPALDLIFAAAQRANSQAAKAPVTPDFLRGR